MICNDDLVYNIPNWKFGMLQCDSPTVGANCRGFVMADVLMKGLSRGAITTG